MGFRVNMQISRFDRLISMGERWFSCLTQLDMFDIPLICY